MVVHGADVKAESIPKAAIRAYPSKYVQPWVMRDGAGVVDRAHAGDKFHQVRLRRRVTAAKKIRTGGLGIIQQAGGQFEGNRLGRVDANGIVVEQQVERHGKIVVRAQDSPERMVEITIRLRRIPGDVKNAVDRVPSEQIGVAKNLPAVFQRIGGEILADGGRASGGKQRQAGRGQRQ